MSILPPFLQPGDLIGITCPAGFMPLEKAQTCIDTLQEWGYQVKKGQTLGGASDNYFSGTDLQRLGDLQQMLDDPEIKAILCGRGGYGMTRIIDRIDFSAFRKAPKWIIGFSDITLLHAHIHTQFNIATLHAPMAGAFNDGGASGPYIKTLQNALRGEPARYHSDPHPFNRMGAAAATLVGGNLALLAHSVGTPSQIKTMGAILFLEDVGEYLYNVDRMLRQLKRNGGLDGLAGLIIGGFTEMKDTTRPFGVTAEDIIKEVVEEYDYPVCFGFPVGHQPENVALKIGGHYRLEVRPDGIRLGEQPD